MGCTEVGTKCLEKSIAVTLSAALIEFPRRDVTNNKAFDSASCDFISSWLWKAPQNIKTLWETLHGGLLTSELITEVKGYTEQILPGSVLGRVLVCIFCNRDNMYHIFKQNLPGKIFK